MLNNKTKFLLLDTHVWIWLMNEDKRLSSQKYLKVVSQYAKAEAIRISMISVWELGMLVSKKRVSLSLDINRWVEASLQNKGLSIEPLSLEVMVESSTMDNAIHGDPADRMILATAKSIKAALMTADQKMIEYCQHNAIPFIGIN